MRSHPRTRVAGLVVLALVGLAVAVALSVAASTLSRQPIGLSGEPLRAGQTLAPAVEPAKTLAPSKQHARRKATVHARKKSQAPQPVVTVTRTTTIPVAPPHRTDDYGGKRDRDD